jgi:hypothetical protein
MNVLEAQRLGRELLEEVTASATPSAGPLTFLLRHGVDELDDASRDALEAALGRAIAGPARILEAGLAGSAEAVEWLPVFVRVAALSSDPRVAAIVADLVARVRRHWPSQGAVADGAFAVASCLAAVDLLDALVPPDASGAARREADPVRALLQATLDELEGLVHRAYQPGAGMREMLDGEPGSNAGELLAQIATADALLRAHAVTGRVPYAMLAEELVLVAKRRWWQEPAGGFGAVGDEIAGRAPSAHGLSVAVLCGLARAVSGAEWRRASDDAGASYRHDAERVLARLGRRPQSAAGRARADYALALAEWLEGS